MKANKKMYPGGGMLRNEYAQGGAVYGYGMSRGQGAAALASRPPVKPASPISRAVSVTPASMAKRPVTTKATPTTVMGIVDGLRESSDKFRQSVMSNPGIASLRRSVKALPKAGMTAEQKSRMGSLRGAMSAMAAQSAGYSPAAVTAMAARATARPFMATTTTAPSRAVSVIPASIAKRPVTTTATTTAKPTTATSTTAKTASSSGSFSKAFADARAKGLKEFTWNGKKYTTQMKGGAAAKPQATRNAEPVSKMPMKAVASVTKPYFESPTGVMQPASVKTTEMRGAAVQKMPMKPATSVQASTDKGNQYFKPGTMAEYLEERRRKMQSNLIAKR